MDIKPVNLGNRSDNRRTRRGEKRQQGVGGHKLVISTLRDGEETVEAEYQVASLEEATTALADDLDRSADEAWSAEVLAKWAFRPGECSMPDGDVIWFFKYVD